MSPDIFRSKLLLPSMENVFPPWSLWTGFGLHILRTHSQRLRALTLLQPTTYTFLDIPHAEERSDRLCSHMGRRFLPLDQALAVSQTHSWAGSGLSAVWSWSHSWKHSTETASSLCVVSQNTCGERAVCTEIFIHYNTTYLLQFYLSGFHWNRHESYITWQWEKMLQ